MTPAHGLFRDHPPPSLPILLEWLKTERAFIHPGIHVAEIPEAGWGVIADADLEPHELLFNIPVTAILSTRTSSLPKLPSSSRDKASSAPILHLALCVLHELRLERASRWYGYLQSLPRETVLLPVMWDLPELCGEDGKRGLGWLKGTEADRDLTRKDADGFSLSDLWEYYESHVSHIPPTLAHPCASPFTAYLHAFALVTTRAFLIDLYHTLALVPFADILNHSSTAPHTSLCSDSFVCHLCGSLAPCPHDILAPDSVPYRLQDASRDKEDYERMIKAENTVEMRTEAPVETGEEVMNSYGANLGDARLLVEWGYLSEEFAGDGLTWDRAELGGDVDVQNTWLELLAGGLQGRLRDLSHGEDDMLCPPPEGVKGVDLFNLSNTGQVGANLWAFLHLVHSANATSPRRATIAPQILESIENVELLARDSLGTCDQTTARTMDALVRLLETRLQGLRQPDTPLEELFKLRDDIPADHQLEKMALTLSINERSLLESTLNKWRELQQRLSEHALMPP